jgi:hypothetical protein
LPGRELDGRVAEIAFHLASAGRARCATQVPSLGVVLQHLSQFHAAARPGIVAAQPLDHGPGVIVVVPDGPAAWAGIRAGDVLTAVNEAPLPPESGLLDPFDADRARARADMIDNLLARPGPIAVTLLRDGMPIVVRIDPVPVCPSRVRLARSSQRNAYADGTHVLVTTGLLTRLRSDDELAFVLAHEMAHNILGHAAIMRGGEVSHGIGRTLGRSGQVVRGTERAADALAGQLMIDAGFDPVIGAGVLARLGYGDFGLFADHDGASTRIAAMRALVDARAGR